MKPNQAKGLCDDPLHFYERLAIHFSKHPSDTFHFKQCLKADYTAATELVWHMHSELATWPEHFHIVKRKLFPVVARDYEKCTSG